MEDQGECVNEWLMVDVDLRSVGVTWGWGRRHVVRIVSFLLEQLCQGSEPVQNRNMRNHQEKSSEQVVPEVQKESGRKGSKPCSSNKKAKKRKLGWIHRLARSKHKSRHDVWIMDAVRGLYFLFHVRTNLS